MPYWRMDKQWVSLQAQLRPNLACQYIYVPLADSHTTATYSASNTSLVATMRGRLQEPPSGDCTNELLYTDLVTESSPSCITYPPIVFSNSIDPRSSPAMPAHLQT